MNKEDKKTIKERFSFYFNYVLIFLALMLIYSFFGDYSRGIEVRQRIEKKRESVENLEKEREELKARLEEVQSEEFIEKQLRDNLNMSKEGEIVLILPPDEVVRKLAPSIEEEPETLPDPNWKKWVKLFF